MFNPVVTIISAILILALTATAQDTESKIVTLPDDVMRRVVGRILTYSFKPRRSPTSIPLAASQIKPDWLPEIHNIKFNLVSDKEILDYENGVFLFEGPELIGKEYSINVGWGNLNCFGTGTTWKIRLGSGKLRLWPSDGWGRGCGTFGNDPPIIRGLELGETSPNELKGYKFFKEGRVQNIRMGISTKEDLIRIFGNACTDSCDYDGNWTVRAEYISDDIAWTTTSGDDKTEFFAKKDFVGKVASLSFSPKQPISFSQIVFPSNRFSHGNSLAFGHDWGINGFEGAVHTSYIKYTDGYGLTYSVYGEETFNNLTKKPKVERARKKGDLIEVEYSIPESMNEIVYDKRPVPIR